MIATTYISFLDEFQKIAYAVPELEKEAILGNLFKSTRPFRGGPGVFQRYGQSLMEGGKMLSSPQLTGVGKFTPAGLGRRTVGEVAQSAGHHYAHKSTLGNVINPLGGALGGVAEGLTRAAGKELSGAGKAVGGRAGGAMSRVGGGLQRAAPAAGFTGEVAGLAGLGSALHVPLSLQGAVGGKLLGAAAPALDQALQGAGHFAHHAASDVAGNVAQRGHRALGAIGRLAGARA